MPKIIIERLKLKESETKGNTVVTAKQKEDFILSKAYEQIKLISPTQLRPFKPKGTDTYIAFKINFRLENVQGDEGPYRQFFTDVTN